MTSTATGSSLTTAACPTDSRSSGATIGTSDELPDIVRTDAPHGGVYAIVRDEQRLAELTYRWRDGVMVIDHTGVRPALRGQGVAGRLVDAAVADARAEGFRIQPLCSYVAHQFRRDEEAVADVRA